MSAVELPVLSESAAPSQEAGQVRFHAGIHVSDLNRSVRFYRTLFGIEPAKHYPDYAKFEVAQPPLVLALYPSPQPPGGALNHFGLRFPDSAALVEIQRRLEEAGIATQRQEGVECCYSRQTKFWVTDPDAALWEIYTFHEDIDHSGFDDAPSAERRAEVLWQHRLTDPLPERIPFGDGAVDEVALEGTFNAIIPNERLTLFLRDAYRALRPGGKISVHGLVGDKHFPGAPQLPGMAALVQRVPVETEPQDALLTAGFQHAQFEKLGDIHCFSVNGVELRELRLVAWKPAGLEGIKAIVVYKGPMAEVATETGRSFRVGEPIEISAEEAASLRCEGLSPHFAFLES